MKIEEYSNSLVNDIQARADAEERNSSEIFLEEISDILIECEIISGYNECFFENKWGTKNVQIDGYYYDDLDHSYTFFIGDYTNDLLNDYSIGKTEITSYQRKMKNFVEASMKGFIQQNCEESDPAYDLALELKNRKNPISRIHYYIITNKERNTRSSRFELAATNGINSEIHVWDIKRIFELVSSDEGKEHIRINFNDFGTRGIPEIKAVENELYTSYLCTIPGDVLAKIYLLHGARLLEGNVRSFLSTRVKVNKAIRNTINEEPELFFAYNNGIAATATEIILDEKGRRIKEITDLQIINGGQTTASIANAAFEKKDVSQVIVPMKLSVLRPEKYNEMVPKIAKFANSQNSINEADFFSNHPFHTKMERLSRRIDTPATSGNQYGTFWYYERARGQFTQAQMKMNRTKRKEFLLRNPKNQKFAKIDLAKYLMSYWSEPAIVSKGAQNNMKAFSDRINQLWERNNGEWCNDRFYRDCISLAILFKSTEKLVSASDWYKQVKSYRANIVTYTIAILFDEIRKEFPGKMINLKRIWINQKLYKELENQIIDFTKPVYDLITREDRKRQNVTEWCKDSDCWSGIRKAHWELNQEFINSLVYIEQGTSILY